MVSSPITSMSVHRITTSSSRPSSPNSRSRPLISSAVAFAVAVSSSTSTRCPDRWHIPPKSAESRAGRRIFLFAISTPHRIVCPGNCLKISEKTIYRHFRQPLFPPGIPHLLQNSRSRPLISSAVAFAVAVSSSTSATVPNLPPFRTLITYFRFRSLTRQNKVFPPLSFYSVPFLFYSAPSCNISV